MLAAVAFLFVHSVVQSRGASSHHPSLRVRGPPVDLSTLTKNPMLQELIRMEEKTSSSSSISSSSGSSPPSTRRATPPPPPAQLPPEPVRPVAAGSLRNRPSSLELIKDASKLVFKRVVRASTLPASVLLMRERTARKLRECGQEKLSKMFEATYANTLETTGEGGAVLSLPCACVLTVAATFRQWATSMMGAYLSLRGTLITCGCATVRPK